MAGGWCGLMFACLCMATGVHADDAASAPMVLILQTEPEYTPELSLLGEGVRNVLTTRMKRDVVHVGSAGQDCAPRDGCARRLAAKYAASEVIWLQLSLVDQVKQVDAEVYGEDGILQMRSDRRWKELVNARVIPKQVEAFMVQLLVPSEYVGYLRLRNAAPDITVSVDGIVYSQKERKSAVPVSVGRHLVTWRTGKGVVRQTEVEVNFRQEAWVDLSARKNLGGLTWGAAGASAIATTVAAIFLADALFTRGEIVEAVTREARKEGVTRAARKAVPLNTALAMNAYADKSRGVQASEGIMWTSFAVATLTGAMTAILLVAQNTGDDVE